MFDPFGFDFMFSFMNVLFPLVFIFVFGMIIFQIFNGLLTWKKNNDSPRLQVEAKIVGKRNHVSRSRHNHGNMHHSHTHTSNTYYVTFEVTSGDRLELLVPSGEFGYLIEGDEGTLEFQGTRYLGFKRTRKE